MSDGLGERRGVYMGMSRKNYGAAGIRFLGGSCSEARSADQLELQL